MNLLVVYYHKVQQSTKDHNGFKWP